VVEAEATEGAETEGEAKSEETPENIDTKEEEKKK